MNLQPAPKNTNPKQYHTIAAGKWHSGRKNEWYLAISNGGSWNIPPQFAVQMGSTKHTAAGTPLPVGAWYHLVGVREGIRTTCVILHVQNLPREGIFSKFEKRK